MLGPTCCLVYNSSISSRHTRRRPTADITTSISVELVNAVKLYSKMTLAHTIQSTYNQAKSIYIKFCKFVHIESRQKYLKPNRDTSC